MKTSSTLRGLLGLCLALVTTMALAHEARAEDVTFEFPLSVPSDVDYGTSFAIDFDVKLPAGDYRSLVVQIAYPTTRFTVSGTGSPTSGEFANATAYAGGRQWAQQDVLDLTAGAGTRRFRLVGSLDVRESPENMPFYFTVSITGNVAPTVGGLYALVTMVASTHMVRGHGTTSLSWEAYGTGNGGGPIMSGESTPRPGILRRFVFYPTNGGTADLTDPLTYTTTIGSGYVFVRAFGDNWSTNFFPDPTSPDPELTVSSAPAAWTAVGNGGGTVVATSLVNPQPVPFYVDVFVPCADLGKTQAESDAQGSAYAVSTTASASAHKNDGTLITTHTLPGAVLGAPYNLTATCGQGGSLAKASTAMRDAGRRHEWDIVLSAPFGVPQVDDAMVVDVLGPEVTGIANLGSIHAPGFTVSSCNFSSFPGYFSVSEFLARKATYCRAGFSGYQAGDTHLVYYAATWAPTDGALVPATFRPSITISPSYVTANPGGQTSNTAYFNGRPLGFAAVGDTVVETGTEDRFESRAESPAFPTTRDWRLEMTRNGNRSTAQPSPLIDANVGSGKAFAHVHQQAGLFATNPSFTLGYPNGIILDNVPDLTWHTACWSEPSPRIVPGSGPWTSPLGYSAGSSASPWTLAGDYCELTAEIEFHVDPSWPWVDGQSIIFTTQASVAEGDTRSASIHYTAVVTTGMDVFLDGGCWTDQSDVAPPRAGLQLFKATAVNRGSENLADMDLTFVVPPGGIFATALSGPDFPAGGMLEVSRDGGSNWTALPAGNDAAVTHVRLANFTILGEGVSAKRPSFYVGIEASAPTNVLTAGAWVETTTFSLGATPIKQHSVDAGTCVVPCNCPDPTPADSCSTGGCNASGACIEVDVDNGTACSIASDLCVTAAQCLDGTCTATARTTCDDNDACTDGDACDPGTGQCLYAVRRSCDDGNACTTGEHCDAVTGDCVDGQPEICDDQDVCTIGDACQPESGQCIFTPFDCSAPRFYLTVSKNGQPAGVVSCALKSDGRLDCNAHNGVLVLDADAGGICGQ